MSLRTVYIELVDLLAHARWEREKAEERRQRSMRRKHIDPDDRQLVETALYEARARVRRIEREIGRIDAVFARITAEKIAGKAAKLAAEEGHRQ